MDAEEKEISFDIEFAVQGSREGYSREYFALMNRLSQRIVKTFTERKLVQDGDVVLDMGCGFGRMLSRIARDTKKCLLVGIDMRFEDARIAKNRAAALGIVNPEQIQIVVGDGNALPFKDNGFDFVFSHSTFEHIPMPRTFAKESLRVLKEKKSLYITVTNALHPASWNDFGRDFFYSILTPYEFKKFFPGCEKMFITLSGFAEKGKSSALTFIRRGLDALYLSGFLTPELALLVRKEKPVFRLSLYGLMDKMMNLVSFLFMLFLAYQRKKIKLP